MAVGVVIFTGWIPTPQTKALEHELNEMKQGYDRLSNQLINMNTVVDNLRDRNRHAYSLVVGVEPVDDHIWNGGIGGHEVVNDENEISEQSIQSQIDELERKLALQSKYIDQVQVKAERKADMLNSIPSIRPIQMDKSDKYISLLSGFGRRKHPIHKIVKMHKGIDFPGPKGTPIISSGAGKVISVKHTRSGYGLCIKIDHGYGYVTLYAHMSRTSVKVGQKVTRGQVIGKMGRSGTATASHLHYEVHYKGRAIDPIHYCMDGLSPEEYQALVLQAATSTHSFD